MDVAADVGRGWEARLAGTGPESRRPRGLLNFPGPGALRYGGTRPPLTGTRGPKDKSETTVATEGTSEQTASPPATDLELLRAAAGGDRGAFHQLVDRHSDSLFRLAVTMSRSRADAEDVLQETLIGAYRGLAKFDGRASVKTWLTQILVRQSAKMWHKGKRMSQAVHIDSPAGGATAESLAGRSSEEDADRRMDLMAVIQALPDDHREVILLREVQGLSYDEIATTLGVPQGTVESRLHRARAGLRQRLKGYPP